MDGISGAVEAEHEITIKLLIKLRTARRKRVKFMSVPARNKLFRRWMVEEKAVGFLTGAHSNTLEALR